LVDSRLESGDTIAARPPVQLKHLWTGLMPMLLLYFLYTVVRFTVRDRGPAYGVRHAYQILRLERLLHLNWEVNIQSFALPHHWFVLAANWYYVFGFLPVVLSTAALSALLDYNSFVWWRKRFAVTLFLALIGFAAYPLAPPRMLPGMVDTLMDYGPRYYGDSHGASLFNGYGRIPSMVNVFAAMPSMHVAWSIIAGALVISAFRGTWWSWCIGIAHPVFMGTAVIVTANHFLLDVIIGVAALIVAMFLVRAIERRFGRTAEVRRTSVQPIT
jgi:PAP2 superfamily